MNPRAGDRLPQEEPQGERSSPSEAKGAVREGVVIVPVTPVLLSVEEAARCLSVGRSEVFAMIRERRIRSIKRGRRRLIPMSEIDAYVQQELDKNE
jgi:excisionase family DNA binding protein